MKKLTDLKHPIQPLGVDKSGNVRFKQNTIVSDLLDYATIRGMGMNEIACRNYSREDREQFAQLIGYSLSGYGELGYASEETMLTAERMADTGETEQETRIAVLESTLRQVRESVKQTACTLFAIHPDDLHD